MTVYILILALIFVGVLFCNKAKQKNAEMLFLLICLIVIAVIGFRSDLMGRDTAEYRYSFNHPTYKSTFSEPAYYILHSIIRWFTSSAYIASVIKAILCLVPLFFFIRKRADNVFFTLFLFMTFSFGQSLFVLELAAERQCCAIACFSMFLYHYSGNQFKYNYKCFLWLALMLAFHYSSILVVILLLLDKVEIKRNVYLIVIVIGIISFFFIKDYLGQILTLAAIFDKEYFLDYADQANYTLVSLLPFVGTFFAVLFILPKTLLNTIWFKSFFLCVFFTSVLMTFGNNVDRICSYYYVGTIICIPQAFKVIKSDIVKYSFAAVVFVYFTYRFIHVLQILTDVEYIVMPYQSFFEQ